MTRMLNDLVDKFAGVLEQQLCIHYNCVREIIVLLLIPEKVCSSIITQLKSSDENSKKAECSYSVLNVIITLAMVRVTKIDLYTEVLVPEGGVTLSQ